MKDDNPIRPLLFDGCSYTEVMERSNSPVEQSEPQGYYCNLCSVHLNSDHQMNEHLLGQRHQKKMKSNTSPFAYADPTPANETSSFSNGKSVGYCEVPPMSRVVSQSVTSKQNKGDGSLPLRVFQRTCREYLRPIWPNATFSQEESDVLLISSDLGHDCVLLLDNLCDGWFRVGIHLVTALLTANQCTDVQSHRTTAAIWISLKVGEGPDPLLFSPFCYPPSQHDAGRTLRVGQAPLIEPLSEYDLFLTDADYFCTNLSELLFNQSRVCCIIIQDAALLSAHFNLCERLHRYLQSFPTDLHRARVICITSKPLPIGCLFRTFHLISSPSKA
ncbi:Spectrin alpha [Paragonimus heterotremus]|uniref:Spectrin alpha n=1 Tax=Paragonimus heterotremus TaxID=100268 RepID=A0A8J4SN29_9TREM|nr:Spectrin alpha [Paragonimus heterotremus]